MREHEEWQGPDYVELTNDLLFHMVFTMNEKALRSLLSSLLNLPECAIEIVEILNPMQFSEAFDARLTVLDLKLQLNRREYVLVEMQVRRFESWTNRTLLYACRVIDDQSRGDAFKYDRLEPVIQIAIMDHTLFPDHRRFFARYDLRDAEGYRFSDKLQFYVLDLTAVDAADDEARANGLVDWARAFKATSWDAVGSIPNPGVKEAQKTMEVIMSTPTQRQQIWDRRKALLDIQTQVEEARTEGKAEGKAEGKNQLSQLIRKLFSLGRIEDINLCASDPAYREKLLDEFHLT